MHRLSQSTKEIENELELLDENADRGDPLAAAAAHAIRWLVGERQVCPCQTIATAQYFQPVIIYPTPEDEAFGELAARRGTSLLSTDEILDGRAAA